MPGPVDVTRRTGMPRAATPHRAKSFGTPTRPAAVLAAFGERLAPGSYLALSHLIMDGPDAGEID